MSCSRAPATNFLLAGRPSTCRLTTSASAKSCSRGTGTAPDRSWGAIRSRSWYRTRWKPIAEATWASLRPIRPSPSRPRVISLIWGRSARRSRRRFQASRATGSLNKTPGRSSDASCAMTNSTTAWVLASGVYTTSTPRALHAATSMLSRPAPARPTTRRRAARASRAASTVV